MDADQINKLYDRSYAASYNQKFLFADISQSDAEFERKLIGSILKPGMRWLDLACGTGYFLSQFPDHERTGVDLSGAMIERAKAANPGVAFFNQSFTTPMPDWVGRWDLVSCMWYAYGLVSSMAEVEAVLTNMAEWTSSAGTVFLPMADPELIMLSALPYKLSGPWPGETFVTGITWSYIEEGGKYCHAHQFAPHVPWLEAHFLRFFESVRLEKYPPAMPGWEGCRRALVATGKRAEPLPKHPPL